MRDRNAKRIKSFILKTYCFYPGFAIQIEPINMLQC